jgi:hypothetical protein
MIITNAKNTALQILARVDEIDETLRSKQLTVDQHMDLQRELLDLRIRIERLRHEALGVPLAAVCSIEED